MKETEQIVSLLLIELGIQVEPIAVDPKAPRADFRATDDHGTEYLIEVKSKTTDNAFYTKLSESGQAYHEEPSGRTNKTSGKITDAVDQLQSTPSSREAFRIIALISLQEDADVDAEQFRNTLYGTANLVIPATSTRNAIAIPCYYFTYSDFQRLTALDAAIIVTGKVTQLCPNPFGSRAEAFKNTHLHRWYLERHAVLDPLELEKGGMAFVADTDLNRKNKEGLASYIREKYKLEADPVPIDLKMHKYAIQVRKDDFEG